MVKIIDQKEVKELFIKNNCFLLSIYVNNKTKLDYFCKCGSFYSQTFQQFRNTNGCINCSKKKLYGNKDKDIYKKVCNVFGRLIVRTVEAEFTVLYIESTLGYTREELYSHIKSYNFDFKQEWVIDHILPIKTFTDHGIVGIKYSHIINAMENLQPLSEKENSEKSSTYILEEFYKFLSKHNIIPEKYPNSVSCELKKDYFGL